MHAQIVADTLGLPYERVEVAPADTAPRARQRAHGRLPHLHGGGQDPPALRPGDEAAPARDVAGARTCAGTARW